MESNHWYHLSYTNFIKIAAAKKELHQALQIVGMVSRSYLPPDPSDIQATSRWLSRSQSLGGMLVTGKRKLRLALRIIDASLLLLDETEQVIDQFQLAGKNYSDALLWVATALAAEGFDPTRFNKALPYQIPAYDVNKAFSPFKSNVLAEFGGYFSNADGILAEIHSELKSSEIVCWPHHFDIATLVTVESNPDPEKAKTIGMGLSPGDSYYNKPYFYTNTWPYLTEKQVQNETWSSAGMWHLKDWIGAVLPVDSITAWKSGEQQHSQVRMFLNEGVEKFQKLLA